MFEIIVIVGSVMVTCMCLGEWDMNDNVMIVCVWGRYYDSSIVIMCLGEELLL